MEDFAPDSGRSGQFDKYYLFAKNSLCISQYKIFFKQIDQFLAPFIWAGKICRLAKTTLQLPMSIECLAHSNFRHYYWAVVLVTAWRWSWSLSGSGCEATHWSTLKPHFWTLMLNWVMCFFRGPRCNPNITTPMHTTIKVWQQVTTFLNEPNVSRCFLFYATFYAWKLILMKWENNRGAHSPATEDNGQPGVSVL